MPGERPMPPATAGQHTRFGGLSSGAVPVSCTGTSPALRPGRFPPALPQLQSVPPHRPQQLVKMSGFHQYIPQVPCRFRSVGLEQDHALCRARRHDRRVEPPKGLVPAPLGPYRSFHPLGRLPGVSPVAEKGPLSEEPRRPGERTSGGVEDPCVSRRTEFRVPERRHANGGGSCHA